MKGVDKGVICNIHSRCMVLALRLGFVHGFVEGVRDGIIRLNIRNSVDIHVLRGFYGWIWIWKVDEMSKCLWCPNCPYYEQTTSYGTEQIRCGNTDCVLYEVYKDEEEEEESK